MAPSDPVRGCTAGNLLYWLDDEPWIIDLDGTFTEGDSTVHAERARLVGRIETWTDAVASRARRRVRAPRGARGYRSAASGWTCGRSHAPRAGARPRELVRAAMAAAGRLTGHVVDICSYARDASVAAQGAGTAAKMSAYALAGEGCDAGGHDERLAKGRAWQAAWLVDRLGL